MTGQKVVTRGRVFGNYNRIKLTPSTCANNTLLNTTSGDITVCEDVCFGHNVCPLTGKHYIRIKGQERINTSPKTGRDIIVNRRTWLASNVTVIVHVSLEKTPLLQQVA